MLMPTVISKNKHHGISQVSPFLEARKKPLEFEINIPQRREVSIRLRPQCIDLGVSWRHMERVMRGQCFRCKEERLSGTLQICDAILKQIEECAIWSAKA